MLILNAALIAVHPLPDTFQEGLAPDSVAVGSFCCQQALHYGLRRDTGMIFSRHPKRIIALHTVIANQDIFDGGGYGMPQVQRTRNIRRRHANDKGRLCDVATRFKVAALFPETIPFSFHRLRLIGLRQRCDCLFFPFDHFPLLDATYRVAYIYLNKKPFPSRTREGVIYSWYHLVSITRSMLVILKRRVNGRSRHKRLPGDFRCVCSEEDSQPVDLPSLHGVRAYSSCSTSHIQLHWLYSNEFIRLCQASRSWHRYLEITGRR